MTGKFRCEGDRVEMEGYGEDRVGVVWSGVGESEVKGVEWIGCGVDGVGEC